MLSAPVVVCLLPRIARIAGVGGVPLSGTSVPMLLPPKFAPPTPVSVEKLNVNPVSESVKLKKPSPAELLTTVPLNWLVVPVKHLTVPLIGTGTGLSPGVPSHASASPPGEQDPGPVTVSLSS